MQSSIPLNAEARRDNKAFLSEQCRETEENNKMGKTSKLFKKIGDTKGNFHTKMGTIKDRNSKGLTDTEEIKKRWLKYAEKLCQKILNDLDNHNV